MKCVLWLIYIYHDFDAFHFQKIWDIGMFITVCHHFQLVIIW